LGVTFTLRPFAENASVFSEKAEISDDEEDAGSLLAAARGVWRPTLKSDG